MTTFEGVAFRYSNYDTPFWARRNSSPGRWHVPDDGPTQYLSVSVEGSWAELIRTEGLQTEEEVGLIRMPMWAADLHVGGIADYSDFDKADVAGFPPEALVDEDYSRSQREGHRLREKGFTGVMAPSAALAGAVNVTLFGPRIACAWGVAPILASSVPTHQIAIGAPPAGLVRRVRQHGQQHAGYVQWARARGQRAGETS